MPKLDERLAAAELKVKQLKTRQRQIEARQRSIATKNQRSQDARRKILVGAIVLAKVEPARSAPPILGTGWITASRAPMIARCSSCRLNSWSAPPVFFSGVHAEIRLHPLGTRKSRDLKPGRRRERTPSINSFDLGATFSRSISQ